MATVTLKASFTPQTFPAGTVAGKLKFSLYPADFTQGKTAPVATHFVTHSGRSGYHTGTYGGVDHTGAYTGYRKPVRPDGAAIPGEPSSPAVQGVTTTNVTGITGTTAPFVSVSGAQVNPPTAGGVPVDPVTGVPIPTPATPPIPGQVPGTHQYPYVPPGQRPVPAPAVSATVGETTSTDADSAVFLAVANGEYIPAVQRLDAKDVPLGDEFLGVSFVVTNADGGPVSIDMPSGLTESVV